jgi:hypothetical protein
MCRPDFRIDPPLPVRAGLGRSLGSIEDAVRFLSAWSGRRPGLDWGDVLVLLESVRTEEQAASACVALRALLERHGLLAAEPPQGRTFQSAEDDQWQSQGGSSPLSY